MKSATGCGIKLREKLCSYVWLASPTTNWATATPRRSAANTRRNRPHPNLAAPTWPLNSCREHMRRRHPGKAGVQDRLFDLPQQADR